MSDRPRLRPSAVSATGRLVDGRRQQVLGSTVPRLWTPPARELTPDTSFGFDVIEFARDVLERPLDPWQQWVVIHAGELLEDGRPRFRKVLICVARQNGKTELGVVLSLYWMFVERVPLVLGTSTKLAYAVESWEKALTRAQAVPELDADIPKRGGIRRANGETALKLANGSRYLVAASNEEGGRSLTIDRLILDELRHHYDYSAWDAAVPATDAVADAQVWCLTNAGSDRSIVLNTLRDDAVRFAETGRGDSRLFLAEYSAPPEASPLDIEALAQANPNLGRRNDPDAIVGDAMRAVENGGLQLLGYKTERMCIRVPRETPPAFPAGMWEAGADPGSRRVGTPVLAIDVSPDRAYASVAMAAARSDGLPMAQLVRHGKGTGWLVPEVLKVVQAKGVRRVALDSVGPSSNLKTALTIALGKVGAELVVMTTGDVCDAFATVYDSVTTGQFRHLGQAEVDDALAGATTRMIGSRMAWDGREVGADITPVRALTHAAWLHGQGPGESKYERDGMTTL